MRIDELRYPIFVSMFSDAKKRSLIKGVSWRFLGSLDTFVLSYLIFDNLEIALPITLTEIFSKILLYYFHERIWNKILWGRIENKPSHLRSIVKGISWRFFGTLDTIFLSLIITGHAIFSITLGGVEVLTKIALFYLHERLWSTIKWGRIFEKN